VSAGRAGLVAVAVSAVLLAALAIALDWVEGTRSEVLVVAAAALVVLGVAGRMLGSAGVWLVLERVGIILGVVSAVFAFTVQGSSKPKAKAVAYPDCYSGTELARPPEPFDEPLSGRLAVAQDNRVLLFDLARNVTATLPTSLRVEDVGTFSDDGKRLIALGILPGSAPWSIYLLAADGAAAPQLVTRGSGNRDFSPIRPSWDSRRGDVAFEQGGAVYTVLDNGRLLERVAKGEQPELSRWRDELVFVTEASATSHIGKIVAMARDGGDRRSVARGAAPSLSPDGDRLAFAGPNGICVMPSQGGGRPQLVAPHGFAPAWSPDGKLLAFKVSDRCNEVVCTERVDVLDVETGRRRRVGIELVESGRLAWGA
jgi:Tol biopolymer transport system component